MQNALFVNCGPSCTAPEKIFWMSSAMFKSGLFDFRRNQEILSFVLRNYLPGRRYLLHNLISLWA